MVVFTEEGQFLRRIGCENITNFPNGIDISGKIMWLVVMSVVDGSSQMLEIFWLETLMATSSTWWSSPMTEHSWESSSVPTWRFEIFPYLLQYFTVPCPEQVSRCCGLKITSEGYVVTLAKNNHHVLVLNTLYIAWVSRLELYWPVTTLINPWSVNCSFNMTRP